MTISIAAQGTSIGSAARMRMKARLLEALDTASQKIRRMRVSFKDINGPKGGVDKECVILVHLDKSNAIVIKSKDSSVSRAFSRSMERLKTSLKRRGKKVKKRKRHNVVKGESGTV